MISVASGSNAYQISGFLCENGPLGVERETTRQKGGSHRSNGSL